MSVKLMVRGSGADSLDNGDSSDLSCYPQSALSRSVQNKETRLFEERHLFTIAHVETEYLDPNF